GILATTSGGSSSADSADWAPLQGRSVVLWPDNDEAGRKYAEAVTAKLQALGCTVEWIAPDVVASLPPKGDCVGWLAQHPDATAADVAALPTVDAPPANPANVANQDNGQEAPEPLRRPMPEAEPYPLDALGKTLGDAAKAIHAGVQAPTALCATSVLAAASLAVQGLADVEIDGRTEPLTLWAVTIGESGERKSAVDELALGAHRKHEKQALEIYGEAMQEHLIEAAAFDAAQQKAKGAGKGNREAIRQALKDVGEAPTMPLMPALIYGEPTLEGVQKQLIRGLPTLGLFSSDAGEFLGGWSMGREQRTRTGAALSKLWDNGCFDRVRAKADEVSGKYYGRRLALHLMAQPVVAEGVLSDVVLIGQGFLPRCLLAWPQSTIGTRQYQGQNLNANPALRRYWAKIHALLDKGLPIAAGTQNELAPPALTLAPDAYQMWVRVLDGIERQMTEKGAYASVKAWASKAGSQVLRIAGVLTLIEDPDAHTIGEQAIEHAAELVLWHLGEAVRIVGTAAVPPEIRNAEKLRDWCHETGRTLLCSAEALQFGPGSVRTKRAFDAALSELESAGWAIPLDGGATVDGKHRRRAWRIVRAES
ncbi:MAG: DUF3987 domain-containing protein, partial [Burkholderiaceae bacterium]